MSAQSFGKYQLLKKIATGGMAEVWLARQTGIEGFQRTLVVKRILPHLAEDPEFIQMFLNEAKLAARFNHPNIAQIYELGEEDGSYFIAMEFVHGDDLGRVVRKAWSTGQWIARPLAIRIVASCCEGLYYAHSRTDEAGKPLKVVHRDISPQNILISFDGTVKLVDFGIAKAADSKSFTKSGAIKGKFAYMSPEQAAGKHLDQRSDIFSIGLVLYELLTCVRPLKRDSEIATLQAALECAIEPPSEVSDVPAELDDVVMRAVAKSPDDRYRDARQFQIALEEFLVGQQLVAGSVQLAELMTTLFADRLKEEARLGHVAPGGTDPSSPSAQSSPAAAGAAPDRAPAVKEARTETGAAEMTWDAPPGDLPAVGPQRRRTGESTSVSRTSRTDATTLARTPSRSSSPKLPAIDRERAANVTRIAPAEEDLQDGEELEGKARAEEPPRGSTRVEESPARPHGAATPRAPPRSAARKASQSVPARPRVSALDEEPDRPVREEPPKSPPRPRRARADHSGKGAQLVPTAEIPELERYDVEELKERARRRLKRVLQISVALGSVLLLVLFHKDILNVLTSVPSTGQEIYLTVDTNIPVTVLVKHHQDERPSERVSVLGEAPGLTRAAGAHLRDTIILQNLRQGAYYEEEIPFGQPRETKVLKHEFRKGFIKLELKPRRLGGLPLYRNGQEVGRNQYGLRLELYEGKHLLELRGAQLEKPITFDVDVKAGQTVTIARDFSDKVESNDSSE